MKRTPKNDAQVAFFAAAFIFAGGLLGALEHYEPQIAGSHERAEELYRKAAANDRIAAQTGPLQRARAGALADLARISKQSDAALSTADFIGAVQAGARRFGVTVAAVEPQIGPAGPVRDTLQQAPVSIRLRGHFKPLLYFVSDLPEHELLVDVSDVQLTVAPVKQKTRLSPLLDAVVHATLFRLNGRHAPTV